MSSCIGHIRGIRIINMLGSNGNKTVTLALLGAEECSRAVEDATSLCTNCCEAISYPDYT